MKVLGCAFCLSDFIVIYYCQGSRCLRFLIKMQSLLLKSQIHTVCACVRGRVGRNEEVWPGRGWKSNQGWMAKGLYGSSSIH